MELISKADVVLALGTRLNPFSTLPGYGIDYWPKNASIIQVDMNPDRIGLTKKVTVGICGDAKLVSQQLLEKLSSKAGGTGREERKNLIHQKKSAWLQTLTGLDHEDDDPGTVWNKEARERDKDGYTSVKHQREVGTSYFDAVSNTISSGKSSTTAMKGSTESEQF